jgi:hypothetical protein
MLGIKTSPPVPVLPPTNPVPIQTGPVIPTLKKKPKEEEASIYLIDENGEVFFFDKDDVEITPIENFEAATQ